MGAPGVPKSAPRGSRESPRALQELPGSSQERSESALRVPKRAPDPEAASRTLWSSGYARKPFAASSLRVVSLALRASNASLLHFFVATS